MSSTFDAIPFVRDYLQKEIEGQLRTLLMDEVPVIIHRLSQRLWVPEYRERDDKELSENLQGSTTKEKPIDPLASPPQDPVDASGNTMDASQITSMSLESGSEMHALFSQKNLLRLGALTDSHRTLSLFTPSIRDVVFRAWTGPNDRGEVCGTSGRQTPATPALTRAHSFAGNTSTTYTFAEVSDPGHHMTRPGMSNFGSFTSGPRNESTRTSKPHGGRKKKHRIINLRKKAPNGDELESVSGESSTASGTMSSAPSEFGGRPRTPENRDKDEITTPPSTPEHYQGQKEPGDGTPLRFRNLTPRPPPRDSDATPRASMCEPSSAGPQRSSDVWGEKRPKLRPSQSLQPPRFPSGNGSEATIPYYEQRPFSQLSPSPSIETASQSAAEQPWMAKIAGEIARKMQDQKAADGSFWDHHEREETPPPAYGA